jgi:hypothetical protein
MAVQHHTLAMPQKYKKYAAFVAMSTDQQPHQYTAIYESPQF